MAPDAVSRGSGAVSNSASSSDRCPCWLRDELDSTARSSPPWSFELPAAPASRVREGARALGPPGRSGDAADLLVASCSRCASRSRSACACAALTTACIRCRNASGSSGGLRRSGSAGPARVAPGTRRANGGLLFSSPMRPNPPGHADRMTRSPEHSAAHRDLL